MKKRELQTNLQTTGCAFRWSYPVIKYDRAQIRTCCSVGRNETVSEEDLKKNPIQVFLNSPYVLQRRIEMLQGIQHSDCAACWKVESSSSKSQRQQTIPLSTYLGSRLSHLGDDISEIQLQGLSISHKPQTLELQLDNVCDLMCVYCNADYSSTWAKQSGRSFAVPEPEHLKHFHKAFWEWYQLIYPNLAEICIVGGEPLHSPHFFDVLDRLQIIHERGSQNRVNLVITSNFNARAEVFDRFLQKVDSLKFHFNIILHASIEATHEQAEFIREGLVWERFQRNVETLLKYQSVQTPSPVRFSLLASQNVFSLTCLQSFLKWVMELEDVFGSPINIHQNIISFPEYLSIQSVLSSKHAHYCYEGIALIEDYSKRHLGHRDLSKWENYSVYLKRLAVDLEKNVPDSKSQKVLGDWLQCLSPQRKEIFAKYFSHFAL